MKRILPNNHHKRVILPSLIIALLFIVTKQASANSSVSTNVNISTNTGGNSINGQSVSTSNCHTKVTVNGKVYESNDCNQSYDYSDDSNGGKSEVHINSNKSTNVQSSATVDTDEDPEPTVDIEPTIAQHKQEVKQKIAKVKAENEQMKKTLFAQIEQQLKEAFGRIANMFKVFARN